MKGTILIGLALLGATACNNADVKVTVGKEDLPSKPADIASVKGVLGGHTYAMAKTGALSPFDLDKEKEVEWFDTQKDTSRFFRDFQAGLMKTAFRFEKDSLVEYNNEGKMINGKWSLDTLFDEGEDPGMRLRVHFLDSTGSFGFPGANGPVEMTYSFKVMGCDEKGLLLELPREFNRRKVVGLFNKS